MIDRVSCSKKGPGLLWGIKGLAGVLILGAAVGAVAEILPPPEYQILDANQVNMATGQVAPTLTDLAIGGDLGLTHSISADGSEFVNYESRWGARDSFYGGLRMIRSPEATSQNRGIDDAGLPSSVSMRHLVSFLGQSSTAFRFNGDGTYEADSDLRHTLEYRPDIQAYVHTLPDGTQRFFDRPSQTTSGTWPHVRVSRQVSPNGFTVYFDYNQHGHLSSVRTNTGYQLKYNYTISSAGLTTAQAAERQRIDQSGGGFYAEVNHSTWTSHNPASIVGLNNQFEYCDEQSLLCSPSDNWPRAKYTWPSGGMPAAAYLSPSFQFKVTDSAGLDTIYYHQRMDRSSGSPGDLPQGRFFEPRLTGIKPATASEQVIQYDYRHDLVCSYDCGTGLGLSWPRFNAKGIVLKEATRTGTVNDGYTINSLAMSGNSLMFSINGGPGREIEHVRKSPMGRMTSVQGKGFSVTLDDNRYNRTTRYGRSDGTADTFDYDSRGNIVEKVSHGTSGGAIDVEASYPSSCSNRKTCNKAEWISDGMGNKTHYDYHEPSGLVERITYPADSNGVRKTIRYEYAQKQAYYYQSNGVKGQGSPIWLKSAEKTCINSNTVGDSCAGGAQDEVITRFEYDHDNLAMTGVTVTAANRLGQLATLRSCYGYDAYGNRIYEVQPKAQLQSCAGLSEPMAFMTVTRYDAAGRVLGVIHPQPDGNGPLGYPAERNVYNNLGQLERVERGELLSWPFQNVKPMDWSQFSIQERTVHRYDQYGRRTLTAVVDPANNAPLTLRQTNYDAESRVRCQATRLNPGAYGTFPFSGLYNACNQGRLGVDGPDRIRRFTYDTWDNLLREERAVGTPLAQTYVTNTYYPNTRRLRTQRDANGNTTELRYDQFQRLARRVFPSKVTPGAVNNSDYNQYTYDENHNVRTERKRNGRTITNTYDNLNRLIIKNLSDNSHSSDVYYRYDLRGLTLHSRFGSHSGQGVLNTFDGFGNLTRSRNTTGGVTRDLHYRYDEHSNRTRITHPDGYFFAYGFDGLDRINRLSESASTNASASINTLLTVNYAPHGNRHQIVRTGGATTTYHRDSALRLDSFVQQFNSSADNLTNNFVYNPASQITQLTQSNSDYTYEGNENRLGSYTANGLNQYTYIAGQSVNYDANANLTQYGGTTYTYDMENRLVGTSGDVASSFKYDPLGRLFEATIGGNRTQFLYDGDALVAEYNGATGALLRRYVHGDQVDEPWVQYNGAGVGASQRRYLHADHQGSIIAHSNNNGAVTAKLAYDAYGIPHQNNIDRFGYTGQIWFKELGLFHYKARMYSPTLGRFLQTDPIGYEDQMNLYAYVHNDPLNYIDPTGEFAIVAGIPWAYTAIKTTFFVGSATAVAYGASTLVSESAEPGTADSSKGCVYKCDGVSEGQTTQSGKPYIGTADDKSARARGARDGRDRRNATTVGEYDKGDRTGRQEAEQKAMNENGGKDELDNKRNEIREDKWPDRGVEPPRSN